MRRHENASRRGRGRSLPPSPAESGAPAGFAAHSAPGPYSPGGPDAITAWLDLMTSLMHVPDAERRAVREELASHLSDRVRDLTLAGEDEPRATARAIAELGDAAQVARRFQEAIEPSKRRLIMQVAALCLAGTAVLFSGVAVATRGGGGGDPGNAVVQEGRGSLRLPGGQQPGPVEGRMESVVEFLPGPFQPLFQGSRFEPPADEGQAVLDRVKVGQAGALTLERLLALLSAGGNRVVIRWDRLEEAGIRRDTPVVSSDAEASVGSVLREMAADNPDVVPGVTLRDGLLMVAPQAFLDKQDQVLVSYDLGSIIDARGDKAEETVEAVCMVIANIVHPPTWKNNGGDAASMTSFGRRLFVTAPRRHQAQIEWVLGEMRAGASRSGLAGLDGPADISRGALGGGGAPGMRRSDPLGSHAGDSRWRGAVFGSGGGGAQAESPSDRLYVTPEGREPLRVELIDGKVAVREKDRARIADSIEITLPKGWWIKDEWDRPVVPATAPQGDNRVVFTAPYGQTLAGVWRQTGFSGKWNLIMPPEALLEPKPANPGAAGGGLGEGGPAGPAPAGTVPKSGGGGGVAR